MLVDFWAALVYIAKVLIEVAAFQRGPCFQFDHGGRALEANPGIWINEIMIAQVR